MTEVKKENAIVRYLRDTLRELKKVSWPTREEAIRLTMTVLFITILMAIFLALFDGLFGLLLRGVVAMNPVYIGLGILTLAVLGGSAYWIGRRSEE